MLILKIHKSIEVAATIDTTQLQHVHDELMKLPDADRMTHITAQLRLVIADHKNGFVIRNADKRVQTIRIGVDAPAIVKFNRQDNTKPDRKVNK